MIEVLWFTLSCFLVAAGMILFFSMCIAAKWVDLQERIYEDEKKLKEEANNAARSLLDQARRRLQDPQFDAEEYTAEMDIDQIRKSTPVQ
jgi:hypothetical protein